MRSATGKFCAPSTTVIPGLNFEIERLEKRRENQSRIEAKARFAEQIEGCLKSASYPRALELLQQAEPEFPHDAELAELKKAAEAGLRQATEVQRLMTEGQDLCAQGSVRRRRSTSAASS